MAELNNTTRSIGVDGNTVTLRVPHDRLYGRRTRWWPRMILLRVFGTFLASYGIAPVLIWLMRPHLDWMDPWVNETIPGLVSNFLVVYVASTILLATFW
jgi:hypothetical protein